MLYIKKRAKKIGPKTVTVGRLEVLPKGAFSNAPRYIKHFYFAHCKQFALYTQGAGSGVKIAILASIFVMAFSPYINGGELSAQITPQAFAVSSNGYISAGMNFNDMIGGDNMLVVTSSAIKAVLSPPLREQIVLRRVWVPITAYSSTVDQTDSTPFITASGTRTRDGVIAANFLPIGAKVKIPTMFGNRVFTVEDRMNKRYWQRMDIWMPTREQALLFGLRTLPIEIIQEI